MLRRGIPRIASTTVDRLAVFDKLDQGAPVTFVTAPPGFGKTTALVRWLDYTALEDSTVVWMHVPDEPTSPERLWKILSEALTDAGLPVEGTAEHDIGAAIRRHDGRLLMIIDSAERLADDTPAEKLIEHTYVQQHFEVVFLSRRDLAPKAWASHQMDVVNIEPHDLRFSPDETRHLFWKLGAGDRELDLHYVHAQLAGWPALLHVAASRLSETEPLGNSAQTVLHQIAAEMWDQAARHWLDDETIAFCARLALAVHIDEGVIKLAAAMSDDELDLVAVMEGIERFGWLRRSGGARWQFVPVVRSLLRNNAQDYREDAEALHRALIEHYEDSAQWGSALEQATEYGDIEVLTELIGDHWIMIMLAARDELRAALNHLPARILHDNPVIRGAYEIVERSQFAGAPPNHQNVEFPDLAADELVEFVRQFTTTLVAARFAGRLEHAAQLSRQALDWAGGILESGDMDPGTVGTPEPASVLLALLIHSAISLQLHDELDDAFEHFEFANRKSRLDLFGFVARNAHGAIAMHLATKGDVTSANFWARQEAGFAKMDGWIENRIATTGNLARGWLSLETLDESDVREAMRPLNAQRDDDEYWSFIIELQTATEMLWGNPGALLTELVQVYDEYEHLAPPGSYAHTAVKRCMVDLQIAQSAGSISARLVDQEADHPALVSAYARAALLTGQVQKSLTMTLKPRDFTVRQWCEASLLRAAAHLQLNNTHDASAAAIAALRAMKRYGLRTPITGLPRGHAEELLSVAGSYRGFLGQILEADIRWQYPESLRLVELTASEDLVLDGLARGMTAAAIADETFLSVNTIKTHTRTLYRKLGANSRSEALVRAHKLGLLDTWRVPKP